MKIGKILKKIDKKFKSQKFSEINFNSKKCRNGDVFFAIKGTKKNGNKFISEAINKGAKTIISDLKYEGYKNDVLFLNSNNPRQLLSEFACKNYKKKPKNLIAITGTNGKSSIANFFFQILKLNKKQVASIGTLGIHSSKLNLKTSNTTLDPITLNKNLQFLSKKNINNVILEASSHGLKQHRLDGLKFRTGIFTNLSRDHLDYHNTYKDYFQSKMILFNNLMKKNAKIIYDKEIKQSKTLKRISEKKN